MASLEKRPKGGYRVVFRYRGKKFTKALGTGSESAALAAIARLEDNLHREGLGTLEIPDDADIATFLLSDGARRNRARPLPNVSLLGDLCSTYPPPHMAARKGMRAAREVAGACPRTTCVCIGRECPDLDCEMIFEPSEWKSVYMTVRQEDPPSTPPSLNEMIRMIASLGGYVIRRSTQPGTQTL